MLPQVKSRGTKAFNSCAVRSLHTATTWPGSSTDHLLKNGSTPSRVKAKSAVHFACHSSMTDHSCYLTGLAASTRHKQLPTNSVTRITTLSSQIAHHCKSVCQWRSPKPQASSAKLLLSKKVYRDFRVTNVLLCSTPISVAPTKSLLTFTVVSCSRPKFSLVASVAHLASANSTK